MVYQVGCVCEMKMGCAWACVFCVLSEENIIYVLKKLQNMTPQEKNEPTKDKWVHLLDISTLYP